MRGRDDPPRRNIGAAAELAIPPSQPTAGCGTHEFRALDLRHPADCFGDVGAAKGPILMAMACEGLRRGDYSGPILCFASSDGKARGAAFMTREES